MPWWSTSDAPLKPLHLPPFIFPHLGLRIVGLLLPVCTEVSTPPPLLCLEKSQFILQSQLDIAQYPQESISFLVLGFGSQLPSWTPPGERTVQCQLWKVHTKSCFFILISRFRTKLEAHTCCGCHGRCKGILNVDSYIIQQGDSAWEKKVLFFPFQGAWPWGVVALHGVMQPAAWCMWPAGIVKRDFYHPRWRSYLPKGRLRSTEKCKDIVSVLGPRKVCYFYGSSPSRMLEFTV